MKEVSKERVGELFIISHALVASLFPIITKISLRDMGPIQSLAWSIVFALVFFLGISLAKKSWGKLLDREVLPSLIRASLTLGILFPILQFWGLQHTSVGNAGIILSLEVFFAFLFFNVWKKEHIGGKQIFGGVLMLLSAVIIFIPNLTEFNKGDFIILLAVMVPPLGNLFQKRARQNIDSESVLLFRSLVAIPTLFVLAFLFGQSSIPSSNGLWFILLINGFVYFGLSKILWVEGIHRISITKSSALNSIIPAFTILFAFLFLKNVPTLAQILAIPPTILGVYLLTRPSKMA